MCVRITEHVDTIQHAQNSSTIFSLILRTIIIAADDVTLGGGGCKNVLEVVYHHAKFGGVRISPAAGAAKNVEFFVCLFVCLFVCPSRF